MVHQGLSDSIHFKTPLEPSHTEPTSIYAQINISHELLAPRHLNLRRACNAMELRQIGTIRTPFKPGESLPIQSSKSIVKGTAELEPEYMDGLRSLDGFSHIILLYWFHRAKSSSLIVTPYLDEQAHGVFATRSPFRPNPIGISVVRLENIERNILNISCVDMADGTPVLDIKPYVPGLNPREGVRLGWLQGKVKGMNESKSGER